MTKWAYGDLITLRWRRSQPANVLVPVRVVEDSRELTILFLAVNSPMKVEATADGRVMERSLGTWFERQNMTGGLADWRWTRNNTLMIQQPGSYVSAWLFWREGTWEFNGYYVNLQAPLARTEIGFDSADYMLDIVVRPDFSWEWKDEDEFAEAREHRVLPENLLDTIQAAGEAMIPVIESRSWPFDAGYESWRPDPSWDVPELPSNWADGLDLTGHRLF